MNFEKYIGIPYAEKGRDETGLDCWGLVRLVYKNELNIDLPSFSAEYDTSDNERLEELFAQYKEGWESTDTAEVGDVVIFRIFGYESHIGVCVGDNKFLHVREARDSVIESLDNPKWSRRITGFFKYSEKKNAVLNTVPHPLRTERYTLAIVPGTTVSELVKDISTKYNIAVELKSRISILINGRVIAQENWNDTVIKESDVIEYRAVPGKDTLRTLAILAVAIYAPQLASMAWTAAGGVTLGVQLGAAVYYGTYAAAMLVGSALINAIAPIRPPSLGNQRDPGSAERQLMVNGGSNRANAYGAIPVVLGKVRVTPLLGSTNFLTYENERDSYLSMLLVWGYGPLSIDDNSYKIGDVPLSSYDANNITKINDTRITELSTEDKRNFDAIYGKDVTQINTQVELVCDGNPESTVTPGPWFEAATVQQLNPAGFVDTVNSVTLALHFPQGLRKIVIKGKESGASAATSVQFRAEYSINDGVSWSLLEEFTIGGDAVKKDGFTFTKTYNELNYDKMIVRVRRQTGDNTEDNPDLRYYFQSILQNVTFLRNTSPAVDPVGTKIAKTAFKINATKELNGNIQGISAVVQTYCKIWNGTAWVDGVTSNPAALMRYVLEHPANPKKITDAASQINLTQLQYFYNYCQSNGFEYNGVLGESRSVLEVIRDICAAGRASPALVDGKWSVVIDEAKPNVVQHFTPHNSWNFEGSKALPKRPDGLRVTYYDQDQDYQQSEIIVYDVDKDSTNAELFESITLPGVTKSSLVIDHAKWHMAQMKLRPELYTLESDIEYLVCNRGDRVKVMHDVPMWGLGSGRIKNRISSTTLELDEEVPIEAGKQYTIRFRSKSGLSVTRTVAVKTESGYYSQINLTSAVTSDEADALDLFLFGEINQESQDLIVLSIEPTNNNGARITLVDYGVTSEYNIFTQYLTLSAATVFESQITLPPVLQVQGFGNKTPLITGFVSDESVMERVSKGVFKYNINVAYFNASQLPDIVESVEVQYDLLNSTTGVNFRSVFVPFQNGSANITDVNEGETYKVRMRYVGRNGIVGNWTTYSDHTVVGKTNPPSEVTEFTVTSDKSSGQLLLSWHPNAEYDVSTYEIRTEDSGWGVEDFRRVFYGDNTKAFVKYPTNGSFTFYIRAVDTSGNYSLVSAVETFVPQPVPNIVDIVPTFSDTALTSATVTLNWVEVSSAEFDVAFYEVVYNSTVRTVKGNSITLPADWVGNRSFTIKTVDIHGNESSGYPESVTKFAPDPVSDLRTQVIDNNVMLYWTLPERTSLPIDHVLIKKGASWDTAQVIGDKKGAFTTVNENQGGEYTYWLAAVDTEGIESTPVSVKTLVSEPPDFVFHGQFESNFGATKSSAYLENNRVVLPVNTTETFEQHFTTRSWTSPQSQVDAGYPVYIQPATTSGYYEEVFDFGQPLASSKVTLTYQGAVVAGSPVVTPMISLSLDNSTYVDYNGAIDVFGLNFRYVKIRVTVSQLSKSGTYVVNSNICTVSITNHGLVTGQNIGLFINSGSGANGVYTITSHTTDTFTVAMSVANTSGNCSVYPQLTGLYELTSLLVRLDAKLKNDAGNEKCSYGTGTYSQTGNIATISLANHGLIADDNVFLSFTSGLAQSSYYTVQTATVNSFTVMISTPQTTSGNVTLDPLGTIVNFNKEFIDVQSITLSPSGSTPLIPVYNIKDAFVSGEYSVTSNVCTVNISNHGMITGQNVKLFTTSGGLVTGVYTITSHTTNSFTVSAVLPNTSGNCSMYPQSFTVYVFNNSGTRVSSTISWAIKGY